MDTGVKISTAAHSVLIGFAMFGAPLFSADSEKAIQISEVSLITSEDFEKIASGSKSAPAPKPAEVQPTEPEPVEPEPVVPDPIGEVAPEPTAPIAETDNIGEPMEQPTEPTPPKPAKTISNAVVETPTDPVKPEATPKPAVIAVPTPAEPKEPDPEPAAAAKESTTKIVTEADTPDSKLAPSSSSRPKGRPKNLKLAEVEKPKPQAEKPARSDPAADAIAAAIAADIANAVSEASKPATVSGPPLTGGETSGLVFAIQECWNVPVGLENDASNIITMGVKLTRDGRLEEEPRKLAPMSGSAAGILQAFEAARRALIRCQPYDLPADKYETWREIEIVFNPQQMVLR